MPVGVGVCLVAVRCGKKSSPLTTSGAVSAPHVLFFITQIARTNLLSAPCHQARGFPALGLKCWRALRKVPLFPSPTLGPERERKGGRAWSF